jgi:hypothetical protein
VPNGSLDEPTFASLAPPQYETLVTPQRPVTPPPLSLIDELATSTSMVDETATIVSEETTTTTTIISTTITTAADHTSSSLVESNGIAAAAKLDGAADMSVLPGETVIETKKTLTETETNLTTTTAMTTTTTTISDSVICKTSPTGGDEDNSALVRSTVDTVIEQHDAEVVKNDDQQMDHQSGGDEPHQLAQSPSQLAAGDEPSRVAELAEHVVVNNVEPSSN